MMRIFSLPFFLLTAALTLPAHAGLQPSFPSIHQTAAAQTPEQEKIAEGQSALTNKQYDLAEKAFAEAYRLNPKSLSALMGLAMVAHSQGKAQAARDWMNKAIALAPGQPQVIGIWARMLFEQGAPAQAEEVYQKAVAAFPDSTELRFSWASFNLDALKKPANAVTVLREAVRRWPEMPAAHFRLGVALATDNKPEAALAAFDKSIALRPDPAAHLSRAGILSKLGRTEAALQACQHAAALAPSNALPHILRGQLLERNKRLDDAEAAYRDALKAEPDNTVAMNNLAYLLAERKIKLDDALVFAQKAVNLEPERANYLDTLGVVQQVRGDAAGARQSFEKAIALEPGNTGYRQRLTQLKALPPLAQQAPAPATPAPSAPVPSVAPPPAAPPAVPPPAAPPPVAAPPTRPAVTAPIAKPAEDPAKILAPRLEAWRQAWEAKDPARYLAFYAKNFAPSGKSSRAAWEADRRAKLGKPGDIQVRILNPAFKASGEKLSASFRQEYASSNYRDATDKTLEWVREDNEWRIQRELQGK